MCIRDRVCGLAAPPVFLPIVGNFYSGMLVSVPLHRAQLLRGAGMDDVRASLANLDEKDYATIGQRCV